MKRACIVYISGYVLTEFDIEGIRIGYKREH